MEWINRPKEAQNSTNVIIIRPCEAIYNTVCPVKIGGGECTSKSCLIYIT